MKRAAFQMMIAFAANVSVHIGETIKRNKHCERETIWLSSIEAKSSFLCIVRCTPFARDVVYVKITLAPISSG